jgi:putative two-component system response regulator
VALVSHSNATSAIQGVKRLRAELPRVPIITEVAGELPLELLKASIAGADDCLKRPVFAWEWQKRTRMYLDRWRMQNALKGSMHRISRLTAQQQHKHKLVQAMACAEMLHDEVTGHHEQRTGRLAAIIGQALGLPAQYCDNLGIGASLHDFGKIAIPDSVLRKPGAYTDEDFEVMRRHTAIGYEIMRHSGYEPLQLGAEAALTHHERYDGSGYPSGLAGESIPLVGRITAVADVFDAMTDSRTYRYGVSITEGLAYLRKHRGTLFDPDCVEALFSRAEHIGKIKRGTPGTGHDCE